MPISVPRSSSTSSAARPVFPVCRRGGGDHPCTEDAWRSHQGGAQDRERRGAEKGLVNLGRHLENLNKFGLPVAVAINNFITDTEAEAAAIKEFCADKGVEAFRCTHWAEGSKGTEALARHVVTLAEGSKPVLKPLYGDDLPLWEKIKTIAKEIYRADDAVADTSVRNQLREFEAQGYGKFPICMAKTQYSFSTDPNLKGAPSHHVVPIREVRLSAGAEFVVAICGDVMTMPGLPKVPSARSSASTSRGRSLDCF